MARTELGLIIDGQAGANVSPHDVEEALATITAEWEWQDMDFIKDVRVQNVQFQDEVPPNPPVEVQAVVVALRQMPTSYVDGTGEIYNGPPDLDNPLHDLVAGLYREMDSIQIQIDAIEA